MNINHKNYSSKKVNVHCSSRLLHDERQFKLKYFSQKQNKISVPTLIIIICEVQVRSRGFKIKASHSETFPLNVMSKPSSKRA